MTLTPGPSPYTGRGVCWLEQMRVSSEKITQGTGYVWDTKERHVSITPRPV
jgi:hypothetical protein